MQPTPDFDPGKLAKSLLRRSRQGALATLMTGSGDPYCSLVNLASHPDGSPILLISRLAVHTRNILADSRVSLMLDERVAGDLRAFTEATHFSDCDGVRIELFDAYMTPDDQAPYQAGRELLDFRRFFGPERRDILMLWRNRPEVSFAQHHKREPAGIERVVTGLHCQHYGKALSIEHWEETCDYYIRHFPFDTYGRKWRDRKGQAIHTQSDFMRPLYEWGDTLFANAVRI
jgi:hypothetical protein